MKYGVIFTDLTIDEARLILNDFSKPSLSGQVVQLGTAIPPLATTNEDDDQGTEDGNPFDASGLPWDERIHASTKRKTAKGLWQKRKGAQEIEISNVEAELRARNNGGIPFTPPSAPVAPVVPAPQQFTPPAPQVPVAPVVPTPAPAPQQFTPPAPQVPAAPTRDFNGLMQQIANLFKAKKIAHDYPSTIVARINQGFNITTVTSLPDIAAEPNMIEYAWQCLEVDGNAA